MHSAEWRIIYLYRVNIVNNKQTMRKYFRGFEHFTFTFHVLKEYYYNSRYFTSFYVHTWKIKYKMYNLILWELELGGLKKTTE